MKANQIKREIAPHDSPSPDSKSRTETLIDELRDGLIEEQKKGLPFITASVVIWMLITIVSALDLDILFKNLLVFCCSCPLLPLSWLIGKKMKVNIFAKDNPLGKLGFLFTLNQLLYLLIVMWVFRAVPDKMIMVYAMVFGAHLLPYSWLYRSVGYMVFAILIPILSLVFGSIWSETVVATAVLIIEIVFCIVLVVELSQKIFAKHQV